MTGNSPSYGCVRRNQPANTTWSADQFHQPSSMPQTVLYSSSPVSQSTRFHSSVTYQATSQCPNTSHPSLANPATNMTSARFPLSTSYRAAPPSRQFPSANHQVQTQGSNNIPRNVQVPVTSRANNTIGVQATNLAGGVLRVEFKDGRTIPVTLSTSLFQEILLEIEEGIKSVTAAAASSPPSVPLAKLPVTTCAGINLPTTTTATFNVPVSVSSSSMHSAPSYLHATTPLLSTLLVNRGVATCATSISNPGIHHESDGAPKSLETESARMTGSSSTHHFKVPSTPVIVKSTCSSNAAMSKELYDYIYSPRAASQCVQENEEEQTKFWICDPENYRKELEIQALLDASSADGPSCSTNLSSAAAPPIAHIAAITPTTSMTTALAASSSAWLSVDNAPNMSPLDGGDLSQVAADLSVRNRPTPRTTGDNIKKKSHSQVNDKQANFEADDVVIIGEYFPKYGNNGSDASAGPTMKNRELPCYSGTQVLNLPSTSSCVEEISQVNAKKTISDADVVILGEYFPKSDRCGSDASAVLNTKNQKLLRCSGTQLLKSPSAPACVEEKSQPPESKTDSNDLPDIVDIYSVQENNRKSKKPTKPQARNLNETINRLFNTLQTECFPDNPLSSNDSTGTNESETVSKQLYSKSESQGKAPERMLSLRKVDSINQPRNRDLVQQNQNASSPAVDDTRKLPDDQDEAKDSQRNTDGTSESAAEDVMRCLNENQPSAPDQESKHCYSDTLETRKSPKQISQMLCDVPEHIPDSPSPIQANTQRRKYRHQLANHSDQHQIPISEASNGTFPDVTPIKSLQTRGTNEKGDSLIASGNKSSLLSQNRSLNKITDTTTDKSSSIPPDALRVEACDKTKPACHSGSDSGSNTLLLHGYEQERTEAASINFPDSPDISATVNHTENLSTGLQNSANSNLSDWLNSRRTTPDSFFAVTKQNSAIDTKPCELSISADEEYFSDDVTSNRAEDSSLGCSKDCKSAVDATKLKIKPNLSKLCAKGKKVVKSGKMMHSIIYPKHDFGNYKALSLSHSEDEIHKNIKHSSRLLSLPDKDANTGQECAENVATVIKSNTNDTLSVNESEQFKRNLTALPKSNSEEIHSSLSSSPNREVVKGDMDISPLNPRILEHNIQENANKEFADISLQSTDQDICQMRPSSDGLCGDYNEECASNSFCEELVSNEEMPDVEVVKQNAKDAVLQSDKRANQSASVAERHDSNASEESWSFRTPSTPQCGIYSSSRASKTDIQKSLEGGFQHVTTIENPSLATDSCQLSKSKDILATESVSIDHSATPELDFTPGHRDDKSFSSEPPSDEYDKDSLKSQQEDERNIFEAMANLHGKNIWVSPSSQNGMELNENSPQIQSTGQTKLDESHADNFQNQSETNNNPILSVTESGALKTVPQIRSGAEICERDSTKSATKLTVESTFHSTIALPKTDAAPCLPLPTSAKVLDLLQDPPNESRHENTEQPSTSFNVSMTNEDVADTDNVLNSAKPMSCETGSPPQDSKTQSSKSIDAGDMECVGTSDLAVHSNISNAGTSVESAEASDCDELQFSENKVETSDPSSSISRMQSLFHSLMGNPKKQLPGIFSAEAPETEETTECQSDTESISSRGTSNNQIVIKSEPQDTLSKKTDGVTVKREVIDVSHADSISQPHNATKRNENTLSTNHNSSKCFIKTEQNPELQTSDHPVTQSIAIQQQVVDDTTIDGDASSTDIAATPDYVILDSNESQSSEELNEEPHSSTIGDPTTLREGNHDAAMSEDLCAELSQSSDLIRSEMYEGCSAQSPTRLSLSPIKKGNEKRDAIYQTLVTSERHLQQSPVLKKIFPANRSTSSTTLTSSKTESSNARRIHSVAQVERVSKTASDIASTSVDSTSPIFIDDDDDEYESDSPRVVRRVRPLPKITSSSEDEQCAGNLSTISQDSPIFCRKRKFRHISSSSSDNDTRCQLPRKESRSWRHAGRRDPGATAKYLKSYVRDVMSGSDDDDYDVEDGFVETTSSAGKFKSKRANKTRKFPSKHNLKFKSRDERPIENDNSKKRHKHKSRKQTMSQQDDSPLRPRDKQSSVNIEKSSPPLGPHGLTKRFKTPVDRISSYLIKKYAAPDKSVKKRKLFNGKSHPREFAKRATSSSSGIEYLDERSGPQVSCGTEVLLLYKVPSRFSYWHYCTHMVLTHHYLY